MDDQSALVAGFGQDAASQIALVGVLCLSAKAYRVCLAKSEENREEADHAWAVAGKHEQFSVSEKFFDT